MKKYFVPLVAVLMVLGIAGWFFGPALIDREHSPEFIYKRLVELAYDTHLGELYDELKIATNAKINIDRRDTDGTRPLDLAASHNEPLAAAAFIVAGANVNAIDGNGDTVIHIAVRHHAVDVLKELRRFMPDLTLKNRAGLTPVELAHQFNDEAAANALLAPFSQ